MADNEYMVGLVRPGDIGIEIGVLVGFSSVAFLEAGAAHLHLVDPFEIHPEYAENMADESTYRAAMERLAPYAGRFTLHRMKSSEAAPLIADASVDFVFIDGNHTYEFVKQDIADYWPKVKPGGWLTGHDLGGEVQRAVDEWRSGIPGLEFKTAGTTWMARKP